VLVLIHTIPKIEKLCNQDMPRLVIKPLFEREIMATLAYKISQCYQNNKKEKNLSVDNKFKVSLLTSFSCSLFIPKV